MSSSTVRGVVRSCRDWIELKKKQVEDVRVRAVGWLVDEPDVPAVSGARRHDVRVVGNPVGRRVVLLHADV